MSLYIKNYKKLVLLCGLLAMILAGFMTPQAAHAEATTTTVAGSSCNIASTIVPGLGSGFNFGFCSAYLLSWVVSGITTVLQYVMSLLSQFLRGEANGTILMPAAVFGVWRILLNFVNMFFILFLIIIAFNTIFSTGESYQKAIPNLIIIALLINFSFTIAQNLVGTADGLSNIFIKVINPDKLGDTFMNASGIAKLSTSTGQSFVTKDGTAPIGFETGVALLKLHPLFGPLINAAATEPAATESARITNILIAEIFFIVFGGIAIFSFTVGLIFVICRLVIIWLLLALAPIAWIGYILPGMKKATWSRWWHNLIGWSLIIPVYLFFLMFALMFMNAKPATDPNVAAGFLVTFNDIIYYGLSIVMIAGAPILARQVGNFGGEGVNKLFSKIESGTKSALKSVQYFPTGDGGNIRSKVAGFKQAAQAQYKDYRERGLTRYGFLGTRNPAIDQQRVAQKYGGASIGKPGDETVNKALEKEYSRVKNLGLKQDTIDTGIAKAGNLEKAALLKLKLDKGWMKEDEVEQNLALVKEVIQKAGGAGTAASKNIIDSLEKRDFAGFGGTIADRQKSYLALQEAGDDYKDLKKAFGKNLADNKEITNADIANDLVKSYAKDIPEIRNKVSEAVRKNVENFAETKAKREAIIGNNDFDMALQQQVAQVMAENGDVQTFEEREKLINLLGGRDAEGKIKRADARAFNQKVQDKNVLFKMEDLYRQENQIPYNAELTTLGTNELLEQVLQGINNGTISTLTNEELDTPLIKYAIAQGAKIKDKTRKNPDGTNKNMIDTEQIIRLLGRRDDKSADARKKRKLLSTLVGDVKLENAEKEQENRRKRR